MKNTSIDTGALMVVMMKMVMISSPECRRGCHPKGARVREGIQGVCKE